MATDTTQPSKRRPHVKRRRNGAEALVASALMAQGLGSRNVSSITGIPETTVRRLASGEQIAPEHIEFVKANLKNKFLLEADAALSGAQAKRAEATYADHIRAAKLCAEIAGLAGQAVQHHHSVLMKYQVIDAHSQVNAQVVETKAIDASIQSDTVLPLPAETAGTSDVSSMESST